MEKVTITLENCYGIKSLEVNFNFRLSRAHAIYASNGAMKTSFATTFQDLSRGQQSKDRVHKNRETKREIKDETGTEIGPEKIFVIEPYQPNYKSDRISTLLVNKVLKDRYDEIYADINNKKDDLLKSLKSHSGLKAEIEQEIAEAFVHDRKEFFVALVRVKGEVVTHKANPLDEVMYQKIFNDKILPIIQSEDFKREIANYIDTYDRLLSSSNFFKKGVFNHNNAADIAKNLKDNGFFKASHSVYINSAGQRKEVKSEAELEALIQQEKDTILNSPELVNSFEAFDKTLNKNKDAREFREYIEKNKVILPELDNLDRLKQRLWISYLAASKAQYDTLMEVYERGSKEIEKIVKQAAVEATKWQEVIRIFNDRFNVPFEVTMENQDDVILKREAPNIVFHFKEDRETAGVQVTEADLLKILSNGERRALYILNIIFEVEARIAAGQETLFVVDDIADSFDYKNKYAIIEYLCDMSQQTKFYQLILSHNFDFFRTISSRLRLPRENRWHTTKTISGVNFVEEKYQNNPFKTWKKNLDTPAMLIASIPFVRNLAEYCGHGDHEDRLTSLLHIRPETGSILVCELEQIFKDILKDKETLSLQNPDVPVKNLVFSLADEVSTETEEIIDLERKILLSIAIRLRAEEYIIGRISDDEFVREIKSNQTAKLVRRFKWDFPSEVQKIAVLDQVTIMTPDNIHINSFMYEPILDMSSEHLKSLYAKVKSLDTEQ